MCCDDILGRSKNLSSVFSDSNSPGASFASSFFSSPSSSSSAAPNDLSLLELPRTLGPAGEAKLVRPPFEAAAPKPPLNPENPEPNDANPEVPEALANPVGAGLVASLVAGDLKTDAVELPMAPKGDCSELAKADRLEEAKADEDVTAVGFGGSSLGLEVPSEPNGETEDVFVNALLRGACKEGCA
jgi:hypothetical protein